MHAISFLLWFFCSGTLAKVFVRSPTPGLVKTRTSPHQNHWYVVQAQTGSYLKFEKHPNVRPPVEEYPSGRVGIRYYVDPGRHEEEELEGGRDLPGSLWMLAMLPGMGAVLSGMKLDEWLAITQFDDSTKQALEEWIRFRSIDDDFTIAMLSDDYVYEKDQIPESIKLSVKRLGRPQDQRGSE